MAATKMVRRPLEMEMTPPVANIPLAGAADPFGEALGRHPSHDKNDSLPGKGFGLPPRSRFGEGRSGNLLMPGQFHVLHLTHSPRGKLGP